MATTYDNALQQLYVAYFNRPADPKGLAYWEGIVAAANGDLSGVSAAFAASTEYQTTYAGMSSTARVNAVYNNLFGHDADAAGLAYWANLLDTKQITVDAAVTAIAAGAQGTDLTAYNDKVTAATAFTAALDTDAEVAGYAGDANAAAKAWLSTVTDSTSLTTALDPANLATTVATIVAKGTPFTVAGALAQLDAASTAVDNFVQTADAANSPADTATGITDINTSYTAALNKVAGDLAGGTAGTQGTLFQATTTTDAVRDALIAAQQATNAAQLSADQAKVTADNANIAKVAGLASATTTLAAATSAQAAAVSAKTAADADLAGKLASFQVNNGTTVNTGTELDVAGFKVADVTTTKVTLADGVDATKYTGLTDLIASYNTDLAAATNVTKANLTEYNAQLAVNLLDVAPDANGTITVSGHAYTETTLIQAIAAQINSTTANTVATGATPTVAQIQTELAVLNQTNPTLYTSFKALVDAEEAGVSDQLAAANTTLSNDTTTSTNAHTTYTGEVSSFNTAHSGTVSITSAGMVFTPTTGSATTVATIDATTHQATVTAAGTALNYSDLSTLISDYNADQTAAAQVTTDKAAVAAVATMNPLSATLAADNAAVTADNKAISTLAKDVAALHTAEGNVSTLAGLQATVTADAKVLSDAGYNVITLDAAHSGIFTPAAGAQSDVYIVDGNDATIAAFGLQGSDSLFVGTGYTLVEGSATGTHAVKGNNAALEIFASNDASGNAVLQIETHAYSSSVATTAGEIVTITLTGVDASTLHLDNNGIITSTPAAA